MNKPALVIGLAITTVIGMAMALVQRQDANGISIIVQGTDVHGANAGNAHGANGGNSDGANGNAGANGANGNNTSGANGVSTNGPGGVSGDATAKSSVSVN